MLVAVIRIGEEMGKNLEQRLRDVQHFGEEGGVIPGIELAATSTFLDPMDMERTFHGEKQGCYLYSRHSNPTVNMFGKKMAAIENTEDALGVASGLAAINSSIEQIMNEGDSPGGEIVSALSVYGGTYALFKNVYPKQNIHVRFVDFTDLSQVEKAINSRTKILYVETLSNPLLQLANLSELGKLAKKHNLKFVVDNTFTPVLFNPVQFGADVVVHSCTKFISGSSDMVAGVICSSKKFIDSLRDLNHGMVMLKGAVMDARIAHELYLRLDHLPIRMRAHSSSAKMMAEQMFEQKVPVIYPGLKNHPDHLAFTKNMNPGFGYGGMIAVDMKTSERAMYLAKALQDEIFGLYAVSLGFARTLMSCPSVSTSSEISEADQKKMNLSPGLLRLSIGFTGDDQVMLDRFMKCYRSVK